MKNKIPPALRVTEIFFSIQGESLTTGLPTVFIRLTGCPLRCTYCDTTYAFQGGKRLSIPCIVERVDTYGIKHVLVTGGEPLSQTNTVLLLKRLCEKNYVVSLETSGALDISSVDPRVIKIIDIKTPGSGEVSRNRWDNLKHIHPTDQIKFVICSEADYIWAKKVINEKSLLLQDAEILFSPCHDVLNPTKLAEWILDDRLPVRLQIQLHKYLWGDVPGR